MVAASRISRGNRILDSLPHEEFARLVPNLERVDLEKGDIVYLTGDDIQYAYFPINGLLSLVSTTTSGSTIEVAMVGSEGGVGLPVILKTHLMPYEVTVQFSTTALKISAKALQEEFERGQRLHDFVLRYLNVLFAQISQSIICNRFHTLDETLSRWLLTVHDRVNSNHLDLTHETISNTLGVPRTAVTKAAGDLQKERLISYSRGRISILNRAGLEAKSCECYRMVRDEFGNFLK